MKFNKKVFMDLYPIFLILILNIFILNKLNANECKIEILKKRIENIDINSNDDNKIFKNIDRVFYCIKSSKNIKKNIEILTLLEKFSTKSDGILSDYLGQKLYDLAIYDFDYIYDYFQNNKNSRLLQYIKWEIEISETENDVFISKVIKNLKKDKKINEKIKLVKELFKK